MMARHSGSSGGVSGAVAALAGRKPFDSNKHRRGSGGRFADQGGGARASGGRRSGGVAQAHAIFDKLHGHTRSEKLAAAAAAGINSNTARTQLYHWQRARAAAALGNVADPTREQLQAAAAVALGVKPSTRKPTPTPAPEPAPKPARTATPTATETHAPRPDPTQFQLREGERHTHAVHRLATQMMGRPRSEVIATAVAAGINRNTAGTQYSHWARAQRQVVAAAPDKDPVDALEAALRRTGHMEAAAPAPATPPVTARRVGGPVRADVRRRSTTARPVPAPAVATPPAAPKRALIPDTTDPRELPAKGSPERALHDEMHRAASLFPGSTFSGSYQNGRMTGFVVRGNGVMISRAFKRDTGVVDHSYFQISQQHRGSGAAKGFLAETVKSYQKNGFKSVEVHANIDVGGYAWVRYGFKPTRSSQGILFNHVVRNVEHRQRAGTLSKEAGDEIIKMARENRFNDIAKINTPVQHYDGSSSPLGRNIFLNTNWYGSLSLKNKSQMDTFFKYAGAQ